MRLRLTIILALLNLIAFGTIYFLESRESEKEKSGGLEPILSSSIRNSDRIEISGEAIPDKRTLQRSGRTWKMEEPVVWLANPNAIERIFQSLLFLKKNIHFTIEDIERNNQSLADYGLDNPALVIRLFRDDKETTVRVGATTDVGDRYYLLSPSGRDIFVVNEEVVRAVALDIQDVQSRRLFDINFFDVNEISIQPDKNKNLRIRLSVTEDGWKFDAPIQTKASAPAVDSRLQAMIESQISYIVAEDRVAPTTSGLSSPRMRITLEGGDKRRTFLLGDPVTDEPEYAYGQIEGTPTIVKVREEPFLAMRDAQTRLREKSFISFRVPSLSSLDIAGSAGIEINLQRLEDDSWRVISNSENGEFIRYPADDGVLAELLTSLLTLKAKRFVSDAPSVSDLERYGLIDPQRTVLIKGEKTQELLLGEIDPENMTLYAKMLKEPFVYAISMQIIRNLPLSPLAYRYRVLDRVPQAGKIRSVTVKNIQTDELLMDRELRNDGASWEENIGEINGDEQLAFLEILKQIRNFRVHSYLGSKFDEAGIRIQEGETLPWVYRLEATIELPGGGENTLETVRYQLTERVEGTLQGGGSVAEDVVFSLPQNFMDAWNTLFFDRELPPEYDTEVPDMELDPVKSPEASATRTSEDPPAAVEPDPAESSEDKDDSPPVQPDSSDGDVVDNAD